LAACVDFDPSEAKSRMRRSENSFRLARRSASSGRKAAEGARKAQRAIFVGRQQKGVESPTLSAIQCGQRRSPSKIGVSRTAGFLRWSTTVEHRGEPNLPSPNGICDLKFEPDCGRTVAQVRDVRLSLRSQRRLAGVSSTPSSRRSQRPSSGSGEKTVPPTALKGIPIADDGGRQSQ